MIANLKAVLGLDSQAFKAGVKDANSSVANFQSQLKSVASTIGMAFSVGTVIAAGRAMVRWASDISTVAQNLGIATDKMMALNQAAAKGGWETNMMEKTMTRLNSELINAFDSTSKSAEAFGKLGLNMNELLQMSPDQRLMALAKAAQASGNAVAYLSDIFGQVQALKMADTMRELATNGLPKVSESAARTADQIKTLNDEYKGLWETIKQGVLKGYTAGINYNPIAAVSRYAAGSSVDNGEGTLGRVKRGVRAVLFPEDEYLKAGREADKKREADRAAADEKMANDIAQAATDREAEINTKLERDRLGAYDKMVANHEDAIRKTTNQMERSTGKQKEELEKRLLILKRHYEEDLKAHHEAEEQKKLDIQKRQDDKEAEIAKRRNQTWSKAQDQRADAISTFEKEKEDIRTNTRGMTLDRGNLAAIGGSSGVSRGGFEVETKQLRVQEGMKAALDRMNNKLESIDEGLRSQSGEK